MNDSPGPNARVDDLLLALAEPDEPGCAVGVVQHGRLIYERGVGLANLEYGIPITSHVPFHLASVSKQFTAFAIALLADRGQLGVDDDVRIYLPHLADFGDVIALRHLLHHTSGLRDQWTLLLAAGYRWDDVITTRDVLEVVSAQEELNFRPGTRYSYSNTGYTLLAAVVEKVSGTSLRTFCGSEMFAPLDMVNTHFHDDHTEPVTNRAHSYTRLGAGPFREAVINFGTVGATNLHSTVHDLALWEANFRPGGITPALFDQMHDVGHLSDGTATGYAFGMLLDKHRGARRVYHDGADAAFTSSLARFPDQGLSVIVMANSAVISAPTVGVDVANIYLDRLGVGPVPTPEQWRPELSIVERYQGMFVDLATGGSLHLRQHQARLVAIDGDDEIEFEDAGERKLRLPGDRVIRFTEIDERPRLQILDLGMVASNLDLTSGWTPTAEELGAYEGEYWSSELDIRYRTEICDGCLVLLRRKLVPMKLRPTVRDGFSGIWSDPRSPVGFSLLYERQNNAVSAFRLTLPRSQRILVERVRR